MTLPLVTDLKQFTDQDSNSPSPPVVFWVSDPMGQRSHMYQRLMNAPYQLVHITKDKSGFDQCLRERASVILIDATIDLEKALDWCLQFKQVAGSALPFLLLGVGTDWQCTELLTQGLPPGVQDVVLLSSEIWLRQRLAIALQCSTYRAQSQKLTEQVRNLERLNELKDEFIGTVVHELRTPITNMKVAGQLVEAQIQRVQKALGEDIQSDSFGKALIYLQTLRRECERETVLINNLLDLQSLESGGYSLEYSPIQVENWLTQLVEPFLHRVQTRQLNLEMNIAQPIPPVFSSEVSLGRVLNELLHNACKYTPPGETIQLGAAVHTPDTLELTVKNTGVEIPEDQQARVFEKFYRVPNIDRWKQGGTGLGLALVKQLIAHLGGEIELKSGSGETQFILHLPIGKPNP